MEYPTVARAGSPLASPAAASAGEGAGDERHIHAQGLADVQAERGCDAVEGHHRQDRADRGLEVMEEGRTGVNADREGKERQSERSQLRGDTQFDVVGLCPGRHDDGEKEDGSGSQADALDLDLTEGHADADEEEQEQHGLLFQYPKDRFHDEISV